jgi:pyruvate ferredoxin oxidoreductase gamma subunit
MLQSCGKAAVKGLTEIRIDGRGGQGNVVAAYILAEAGFEAGRFVQAFPSFGPERRGAPVAAFVRVSDRPIRRRCQISKPLYVIVQDPGLLHSSAIIENLLPGGALLINATQAPAGIRLGSNVRVMSFPASALSLEFLGQEISNIPLLAAFLTLTDLIPLEALERAIIGRLHGDPLQRNLKLMREAARRVQPGLWKEEAGAAGN